MALQNFIAGVRLRPLTEAERETTPRRLVSLQKHLVLTTSPDGGTTQPHEFDFAIGSSQESVYQHVGVMMEANAILGFNCSLMVYGQTGSGKSWTIQGPSLFGPRRGVLPRVVEALFAHSAGDDVSCHMEVSYLDVYNERLTDLLGGTAAQDLAVRESPHRGVYVEGLSRLAVDGCAEVFSLIHEGNAVRAIHATNLNKSSCRSHSIFAIYFTQRTKHREQSEVGEGNFTEKVSCLSFVDFAGSEALECSKASLHWQEALNIRHSLATLNNVIHVLSHNNTRGAHTPSEVPYRDSAITSLLRQPLGGNCKTIFLANITPSSACFHESLRTLEVCKRARNIVTQARINEHTSQRMVQELQAEVQELRAQLERQEKQGEKCVTFCGQKSWLESEGGRLRQELAQSQMQLRQLNETWQEKRERSDSVSRSRRSSISRGGVAMAFDDAHPFLVNVSEDTILNASLVYYLKPGITRVGSSHSPPTSGPWHMIVLDSRDLLSHHCTFEHIPIKLSHCELEGQPEGCPSNATAAQSPYRVSVTPYDEDGCYILVNGVAIESSVVLSHGDSVVLGSHHRFRFSNAFRDLPEHHKASALQSLAPGSTPTPIPALMPLSNTPETDEHSYILGADDNDDIFAGLDPDFAQAMAHEMGTEYHIEEMPSSIDSTTSSFTSSVASFVRPSSLDNSCRAHETPDDALDFSAPSGESPYEDLLVELEVTVSKLMEISHTELWVTDNHFDNKSISVGHIRTPSWFKEGPGGDNIWCRFVVPAANHAVFDAFKNYHERVKWDPSMSEQSHIVQAVDSQTDIVYKCMVSRGLLTAARDFIDIRRFYVRPDGSILAFFSSLPTKHSCTNAPPATRGIIRAKHNLGGMLFQPIMRRSGQGRHLVHLTKVTALVQEDLGGWMSKSTMYSTTQRCLVHQARALCAHFKSEHQQPN